VIALGMLALMVSVGLALVAGFSQASGPPIDAGGFSDRLTSSQKPVCSCVNRIFAFWRYGYSLTRFGDHPRSLHLKS
jgi:hypothetical protein